MNRSFVFKACNRRLAINFKCEHWTMWKAASETIFHSHAHQRKRRDIRTSNSTFLLLLLFKNEFASVESNLNARRARNLIDWCVTSYIFDGNDSQWVRCVVTNGPIASKNTDWARAEGNDERVMKCYNFHLSNYVVDKKKKLEWLSCAIKGKFFRSSVGTRLLRR